MSGIEQGPIRPPSEAQSLLLRVTRNCSWNHCEFCHIYKGNKLSLRTVEEVKQDIDNIKDIIDELKTDSWNQGYGGEITTDVIRSAIKSLHRFPEGTRSVLLWLHNGGKNVFLQDADNLILKTKDLVEMLVYLKETFPSIDRITSYSRAKTVARKTLEELKDLKRAGLTRLHIGLESGYDPILKFVKKGVTALEHIDAGQKVKAAGIELSEYYMPGLGGKKLWKEHAVETAKVMNRIDPDFIRLRTLKVLEIMPLYKKVEDGELELMSDDEIVVELRLLIENFDGIHSRITSDHILNLLEEIEGKLPDDKEKMLSVIDRYLALPQTERENFRLGRRAGFYRAQDDMDNPELRKRVDQIMQRIQAQSPGDLDRVISEIMESFI
jgi:radical SAM superfamily enzyme YgiQ (UPF0313 family)